LSLRNKVLIVFFICLLQNGETAFAQPFTRLLNRIPVYDSEGRIPNTFSGGHNNIEHQFVDIDGDGDFDLIYLDSDGTYGWYENIGNKFNPQFILSFDTIPGLKFSDWFYFVDIDNDGDYDLFTGGTAALIEFRRNTGSQTNPFFTLEIDTLLDTEGNVIFSEFGCNPVFIDIDGDGDFDFLTGNSIGTITFYENIGNNLTFDFKFITNFWQDILIIGGPSKPDFKNPFYADEELLSARTLNLHGASSLDFADIDNDGDYDLFWGDFFSRSLYFIRNNGTAAAAQMDTPYTYNTYPRNEDSIWTSGFNMPRLVDIDGDEDLDLFVSVLYNPTVPQSLMFFRNVGTQQNPNYLKVTEDYLKTLDAGTLSTPFFIDIDGDGDKDLFIGCGKSPNGTLHFFENTGSADNPYFILRDSLYFGIQGEETIAPAFGDLDGDGDYDLLIGEFLGRISYYENTGNKFSPDFVFREQLRDINNNFISAGNIARPFLIDVSNNGLLDLVLGGFNGRITLYRNIGTAENYIFERDDSYFGNLDVGDNSAPFLIDYTKDGKLELFTGSDQLATRSSGNIYYYRNDGTLELPVWNLVTDKFLNQSFGNNAAPFFTDIENDGDLDLFIGNVKGGLYYFENQLVSSIEQEEPVITGFLLAEAYPNPFNSEIKIVITAPIQDEVTISVYNLLGKKVKDLYHGILYTGKNIFNWDGKNERNEYLSSGSYFVVIRSSQKNTAIKITFLK
jgi:hypothetical protein